MNFNFIENPKRTVFEKSGVHHWHPYYAGFSEKFVASIVSSISPKSIVYDPWAGSGTTKVVCDKLGFTSLMSDINPAMVAYASSKEIEILNHLNVIESDLEFLLNFASIGSFKIDANDPLLDYLSLSLTRFCRRFIEGIDFVDDGRAFRNKESRFGTFDIVSPYKSFMQVLLIKTIKEFINPHVISKNPTWIKKNVVERPKVTLSQVKSKIYFNLAHMTRDLELLSSLSRVKTGNSLCFLGDSRSIQIKNKSIDCIISSPPYLTRIDYAISTKIENFLIDGSYENFRRLREDSLGTTVINKRLVGYDNFGVTANKILTQIFNHESYAAQSYYHPNILQYFISLKQSLTELVRVLKDDGSIFLVVQNSYFKNINLDLSKVIIEVIQDLGASGNIVKSFPVKLHMGLINKSSGKNIDQIITEDVIHIFK